MKQPKFQGAGLTVYQRNSNGTPLFPKSIRPRDSTVSVGTAWLQRVRPKCKRNILIQKKVLTRREKTLKQHPNKAWRTSKCKEGGNSDPGERLSLKPQGWLEKQWATVGSTWVLHLFAYQPLNHRGSSLNSCMDHQYVDLNPVDWWLFLQQKMDLFGVSKELQSGVCYHGETHKRSLQWRKQNSFKERKRKMAGR